MHQVVRAGRANLREPRHILAAGKCQHVLAVFEAQDLAFFCRDQSAQGGGDLRRDSAPLSG